MNDYELQEKTLKVHLQIIVDQCLKLQSDIMAIILYGGYGRDEGSWFQENNGLWKPYNDYDLIIVSQNKIPAEALKDLKATLVKQIGIKWVDLSQLRPDDMRRLKPSIFNYDLKNAAKVIYGDATLLELIPEIDRAALSMVEAKILFFTRLYTLLGSLDERGLNTTLKGEASRFFRNQMAKAILAVVDVLLLAKNAYDASYSKRVEIALRLYPEKEEFHKLCQWALAEKLRPQAPLMNADDVRSLYKRVHTFYFTEMYRGLSIYFGKSVSSPADVEHCMKWLPSSMLRRIWWIMKYRNFRVERQVAVMVAQGYIAAAWRSDGINKDDLNRGISLLRRADARVAQEMTWDVARLEAARLRMEV